MLRGFWFEKLKKPLGRPTRSWENNIKMDHTDISVDDCDIVHMAPKGSCEGGYEIPNSVQNWEFLDYLREHWLPIKDLLPWS
jgi:hypothetical protein